MADTWKIIQTINEFLEKNNQEYTTPVEVALYLERKNILSDSMHRPGQPLRKIL
jgi:hypothetical protein